MEESSVTNPPSIPDKPKREPPNTDTEITEQELTTPLSTAPKEEWGPVPSDIFIKDAPNTFSPWAVNAVILGILSLLLMVASSFFGYQYFQNIQQSNSNLYNLTKEMKSFHNKLEIFFGTMKELQKGKYSEPCLKHWKWYKDNCYNQTLSCVSWFDCDNLCNSMNATFLKSGNDMIMNFMKKFLSADTWVGISYQENSKEWKWENGSSYPFRASPKSEQKFRNSCLYINSNMMGFSHCNETLPCLCEKALSAEN
ncbi:C-type lectin domain family 1 member B-like [Sminthopsis crassicaudata]|uniref:C-type lectin domain family 1 member B-like n=1 Tax=Sminthopsis crassicaudata TaxID=9301 RepID=UPI003D69A3BC